MIYEDKKNLRKSIINFYKVIILVKNRIENYIYDKLENKK